MTYNVSIPNKLETQSYYPPVPPTPPPITIVKPLSYQFQIIEYIENNKIVKVELQAQVTTHDEYGNVTHSTGFIPVPRIQIPYVK